MADLEQRFDLLRRRAGLVLAPLLFAFVLTANFESLADKPTAHRLAAVMAAVVVLWVTEAIPMPLTALSSPMRCQQVWLQQARSLLDTPAVQRVPVRPRQRLLRQASRLPRFRAVVR